MRSKVLEPQALLPDPNLFNVSERTHGISLSVRGSFLKWRRILKERKTGATLSQGYQEARLKVPEWMV